MVNKLNIVILLSKFAEVWPNVIWCSKIGKVNGAARFGRTLQIEMSLLPALSLSLYFGAVGRKRKMP